MLFIHAGLMLHAACYTLKLICTLPSRILILSTAEFCSGFPTSCSLWLSYFLPISMFLCLCWLKRWRCYFFLWGQQRGRNRNRQSRKRHGIKRRLVVGCELDFLRAWERKWKTCYKYDSVWIMREKLWTPNRPRVCVLASVKEIMLYDGGKSCFSLAKFILEYWKIFIIGQTSSIAKKIVKLGKFCEVLAPLTQTTPCVHWTFPTCKTGKWLSKAGSFSWRGKKHFCGM